MASLSEGKVPVPIDDAPQPVVVAPPEESLAAAKQGVSFEDNPEMAKVVPAVDTAIVPLAKEGKAPKLRVIGSSGSVHDIIDAASMREIGEKMKQHRRMSAAATTRRGTPSAATRAARGFAARRARRTRSTASCARPWARTHARCSRARRSTPTTGSA